MITDGLVALNLKDLGISSNKQIQNTILSLYKVHRAGNSRGTGLFARRNVYKDEEVIRATGPIIGPDVASTLYWSYGIDVAIQVDIDQFILPNNESRFINHSCNPNLGFSDNGVFVAMRDIKSGEELTFDYCTCDTSDDWVIDCLCGEVNCRQKITGVDLFNPSYNLQERYKGYISPYIYKFTHQ